MSALRAVMICLLLLTCAGAASAQDMVFTPSMSWPESASISQFGLLASQARKRGDGDRTKTTEPRVSGAALTFVSSPTRRQANYANFVERSRRSDPKGAADLATTLSSDPITAMAPELAKLGLTTDNVADAYATYWVEAWQAAHGTFDATPRDVALKVKQQAADAITSVPSYAALSDSQKQEFAESLLVQALLVAASKEAAKDDPQMLRKVGDTVRRGAVTIGLLLDTMTLTSQGFVPVR